MRRIPELWSVATAPSAVVVHLTYRGHWVVGSLPCTLSPCLFHAHAQYKLQRGRSAGGTSTGRGGKETTLQEEVGESMQRVTVHTHMHVALHVRFSQAASVIYAIPTRSQPLPKTSQGSSHKQAVMYGRGYGVACNSQGLRMTSNASIAPGSLPMCQR